MNKIINRVLKPLIELIAGLIFPTNNVEAEAEKIISNIAKIDWHTGDRVTKYPCPAYSFFPYRNEAVRSMIWRLKYRGDMSVAKLFANKMYDQLCEELAELAIWHNFEKPILVPIPISKHKLKVRGFNQSMAMCKALSEIDEGNFFTLPKQTVLYKIKDTISQARVKDKKSRLQNLKDSFFVKDRALVENRNIILLDDVLTTGSTLTEATNTLKNAGARQIIWVVVGH